MTPTITLFDRVVLSAPALLQRCLTGRLVCLLIAVPITALAFLPILVQAAKM